MRRIRAGVMFLTLSVTALTLGGCLLRTAQGTVDNCKADSMKIRIRIGIDLAGSQTLDHTGKFTKDFGTHKLGEPCQYYLSSSFTRADEFFEKSGYRVERNENRLTISSRVGAGENADSQTLEDIQKFKEEVKSLSLLVDYAGVVLENNADHVDESTREMTWDVLPGKDREIRFVLQLSD